MHLRAMHLRAMQMDLGKPIGADHASTEYAGPNLHR
jgi:hypothetical protein